MTAIHAQTERKRLDGSVRRAEKHHRRARTRRFRGLIRAVSAACSTTAAAQGGKRLSGGRIQAIFAPDSRQLGECRVQRPNQRRQTLLTTKVLVLCANTGDRGFRRLETPKMLDNSNSEVKHESIFFSGF
jgi:hypothetical protein